MKGNFVFSVLVSILVLGFLGFSMDAFAETIVTTIGVGDKPQQIAVDPSTNTIYVSNFNSGTVSVIDGTTNTVIDTLFSGGILPSGIAFSPSTNTLYVSNAGSGTVSAIDLGTKSIVATIPVGIGPWTVTINEVTNTIYVSNANSGTVSVIDGTTNTVIATISLGASSFTFGIDVNSNTNTIYATNAAPGTLSVIDGTTNTVIATIPVGSNPQGVTVNQITNTVYVTNLDQTSPSTLSVIDGTTNTVIATIPLGINPFGIAVNPTTNIVYAGSQGSNLVHVIDGTTNTVSSTLNVASGPRGIAVNPITDTIYVANEAADLLTVISSTPSDVTPPTLSIPSDVTLEAPADTSTSNTGTATATDDTDPNPVVTFSDSSVPGAGQTVEVITRTWTATDASGNFASSDQTIIVKDTTAPVITLLGDSDVSVLVGDSYTDAGATASDSFDGDLTSEIVIVNPVDTNTPGVYVVTFDVSDNAGNAATQVTRTVTVQSLQDATESISDSVGDLVTSGALNNGNGNALQSKLDNIIDKIDADKTKPAKNQLNAFIHQVQDFIDSGKLTSAEGQPLIDAAQTIIDNL